MNATLEEMAQALFKQWFVDDLSVDYEEKSLDQISDLYAFGGGRR